MCLNKYTEVGIDDEGIMTLYVNSNDIKTDFPKEINEYNDGNVQITISNMNPEDFPILKNKITKNDLIVVFIDCEDKQKCKYHFSAKCLNYMPIAILVGLYDNPLGNKDFFNFLNNKISKNQKDKKRIVYGIMIL